MSLTLLSRQDWMPGTMRAWRGKPINAASGYFRAHGIARCVECDRAAHDGSVPAVVARHRATARCLDRAGAVYDIVVPTWICGWADSLWPDLRSSWPQTGPAGGDRTLLRGKRCLRAFQFNRNAHYR